MKTTATNEEAPLPARQPIFSDIYPLDESYAARGEVAPAIDRVEGVEVPEPYRSLLVHKTDMTSTLEKYYGKPLHIEVLTQEIRDTEYCREVALALDGSKKRVEFGAIKIFLDLFPEEARREVLRANQPLGRILTKFNLPFASRPRAFLRLTSDKFIGDALQLPWPQLLYGRSNSLVDAKERPLAEIVEILPP
jgi:chorismate-pyruvate lyase